MRTQKHTPLHGIPLPSGESDRISLRRSDVELIAGRLERASQLLARLNAIHTEIAGMELLLSFLREDLERVLAETCPSSPVEEGNTGGSPL